METPGADLILRRKATVGRRSHEARGMPPTKALRLALARAAEREVAIAVRVQGIRQEEIDQQTLIDGLEEDQLFLMLDGPGEEQGAVAIDAGAMAALIEAQVLGRVMERTAAPRPPTPTDAAMIAPVIDALMSDLGTNLAEDPDAWWAQGYSYGHMVEDRRALELLLASGMFRSFRMNAEFGSGAKTGVIQLILPVPEDPPPRAEELQDTSQHVSYEDQLCHVPVALTAVVDRIQLSLDEADEIKVGSVLRLSRNAMKAVRLRGADGRDIAQGALGAAEGFLAVRLTMPPTQTMLAGQSGPREQQPEPKEKPAPPVEKSAEKPANAVVPAPATIPPTDQALPELPPLSLEEDEALANLFPLEQQVGT